MTAPLVLLPLALIPVAPTGSAPCVTSHGVRETLQYPPSPRGEALRRWRVFEADKTLRQGAALLGLRAPELSALEGGYATLSDEGWRELGRRAGVELP